MTAHMVIDMMTGLVSELPKAIDRSRCVLAGVQHIFVKRYVDHLAKAILRLLPAFKAVSRAARRQISKN